MIIVAERSGENKKLLAMKNAGKTVIAKVAKVLNAMDLRSKHS